MRFHIHHRTIYRYSKPVYPEPHIVRKWPRSDAAQQLKRFQLETEPQASVRSEIVDVAGNNAHVLWFKKHTPELSITMDCEVETLRRNPYDYLILGAQCQRLPMHYGPLAGRLKLYRIGLEDENELVRLSASIAADVDGHPVKFLDSLNDYIYQAHEAEIRELGPPHDPLETLKRKKGSCRDLSVLFLAAARAVGFAGRFVSGYQRGDTEQDRRDLHAWAEIYMPGGGWRGYDPTHGLTVADEHVAVSASPEPSDTLPISGTFRGTGATAAMQYDVQIRVEET